MFWSNFKKSQSKLLNILVTAMIVVNLIDLPLKKKDYSVTWFDHKNVTHIMC